MRIWRKVAGLSFFDQLVLNFVVKAKKSNRRMDPSLDDSPVIFVLKDDLGLKLVSIRLALELLQELFW